MCLSVFYNAWKVCFVILSVQNFHDAFGGVTRAIWFLGKAGIEFKHLGNARFELQVVDIPHGQEDIINGDGPFLKSNTVPISCKVCLPMIRLYNDGGPPLEYWTISGRRCTFLLAEYLTKESSTLPTFLVLKVPLKVLHDSGTALLTTSMYLLDPFSKKRRSPLDPVSTRTLIVLCLTISLSLVSFGGGSASFRHFLDQFRPNFFDLDSNSVF